MSTQQDEGRKATPPADEHWREVDVGTRIEVDGKTTYHVLTSEKRPGFFIEKVYDDKQNLIRIVKRSKDSRSETEFNAITGDASRIFEASKLPDGNSMTKEIVYAGDKATETVAVVGDDGELIRTVLRESVGIRTIFQGQTDYKSNGMPSMTTNHTMDHETGKLAHREQIRWLKDGQRSVTEHYFFAPRGAVTKYVKVLYHACGGPFIEETHRYGESGHMVRREILQFNPDGIQTAADLTAYDDDGEIVQRSTTYYDHRGAITSRVADDDFEDDFEDYDDEEDDGLTVYPLAMDDEIHQDFSPKGDRNTMSPQ